MESLKGHLLVASTHLPDPNFAKTIVLIVEHDENGALGIVLNRPSKHQLKDVWENVTDETCHSGQVLRLGGPMGGPLMAIHTAEPLADKPIIPGVYFSTEKENLIKLVKLDEEPFRFFSGYAGWGEGQLDGEVASGDWLTMPATSDQAMPRAGKVHDAPRSSSRASGASTAVMKYATPTNRKAL